MYNKQSRLRVAVLVLGLVSLLIAAGCGGDAGKAGGGGGGGGNVTLSLQLRNYNSFNFEEPVTGARIYLVNFNGQTSTRSSVQLTERANGVYEWSGSLGTYNSFLIVPPTGFWRIARFRNPSTQLEGTYQMPLDTNNNFVTPFFDPCQYAVVPLPTGVTNIGTVFLFSDNVQPPAAPDRPGCQ